MASGGSAGPNSLNLTGEIVLFAEIPVDQAGAVGGSAGAIEAGRSGPATPLIMNVANVSLNNTAPMPTQNTAQSPNANLTGQNDTYDFLFNNSGEGGWDFKDERPQNNTTTGSGGQPSKQVGLTGMTTNDTDDLLFNNLQNNTTTRSGGQASSTANSGSACARSPGPNQNGPVMPSSIEYSSRNESQPSSYMDSGNTSFNNTGQLWSSNIHAIPQPLNSQRNAGPQNNTNGFPSPAPPNNQASGVENMNDTFATIPRLSRNADEPPSFINSFNTTFGDLGAFESSFIDGHVQNYPILPPQNNTTSGSGAQTSSNISSGSTSSSSPSPGPSPNNTNITSGSGGQTSSNVTSGSAYSSSPGQSQNNTNNSLGIGYSPRSEGMPNSRINSYNTTFSDGGPQWSSNIAGMSPQYQSINSQRNAQNTSASSYAPNSTGSGGQTSSNVTSGSACSRSPGQSQNNTNDSMAIPYSPRNEGMPNSRINSYNTTFSDGGPQWSSNIAGMSPQYESVNAQRNAVAQNTNSGSTGPGSPGQSPNKSIMPTRIENVSGNGNQSFPQPQNASFDLPSINTGPINNTYDFLFNNSGEGGRDFKDPRPLNNTNNSMANSTRSGGQPSGNAGLTGNDTYDFLFNNSGPGGRDFKDQVPQNNTTTTSGSGGQTSPNVTSGSACSRSPGQSQNNTNNSLGIGYSPRSEGMPNSRINSYNTTFSDGGPQWSSNIAGMSPQYQSINSQRNAQNNTSASSYAPNSTGSGGQTSSNVTSGSASSGSPGQSRNQTNDSMAIPYSPRNEGMPNSRINSYNTTFSDGGPQWSSNIAGMSPQFQSINSQRNAQNNNSTLSSVQNSTGSGGQSSGYMASPEGSLNTTGASQPLNSQGNATSSINSGGNTGGFNTGFYNSAQTQSSNITGSPQPQPPNFIGYSGQNTNDTFSTISNVSRNSSQPPSFNNTGNTNFGDLGAFDSSYVDGRVQNYPILPPQQNNTNITTSGTEYTSGSGGQTSSNVTSGSACSRSPGQSQNNTNDSMAIPYSPRNEGMPNSRINSYNTTFSDGGPQWSSNIAGMSPQYESVNAQRNRMTSTPERSPQGSTSGSPGLSPIASSGYNSGLAAQLPFANTTFESGIGGMSIANRTNVSGGSPINNTLNNSLIVAGAPQMMAVKDTSKNSNDSGFSSFNSAGRGNNSNASGQQLSPRVPDSPCGSPNSTFDRSRGGDAGPMIPVNAPGGNANDTISVYGNDSGNSSMLSNPSQAVNPYANRVFDIEKLKNWVEQTLDIKCPGACERGNENGPCDCKECTLKNMMGLLTHWRALYIKKT